MVDRNKIIKKLKVECIVYCILGLILLGIGFYKGTVYNNPEGDDYFFNDDEESINAYVGGDAYNYIINGTYFTAYSVMGIGLLIISTIKGVAGSILLVNGSVNIENIDKSKSVVDDIESNLPSM